MHENFTPECRTEKKTGPASVSARGLVFSGHTFAVVTAKVSLAGP
ncbi:Hypothetical protein I596_54 [Dokdonella koreensis DS-123]|uniref:Uncharacterized protein n=1 Tax=Dokdonella koreensis DS-123 TaxID=1300342 RepID=A0A167G2T1_9GAMM|nr:Hypothetical protein I596_54 [Dokdonella koreensis DS-123]